MPTFALEGSPDPDRVILDWLTAPTEAEAIAAFQRKHGCPPRKIDGRAVFRDAWEGGTNGLVQPRLEVIHSGGK